ncbi:MAG TPA: DUF4139 domain-containing protein [Nevskiales bacterium]|nr:DUF4139 domain-containing protein [Nevskiales bacterium]
MDTRLFAALFSAALAAGAEAAEVTSTAADRDALALTLYESDLAVVSERRSVRLQGSRDSLVLQDVAARLQPETVQLAGKGIRLAETRFAYDLLTPESLLERFVGREIRLVRTHPTTGADQVERGTLLSVVSGVPVFRVGGAIETGGANSPWRIRFDDLPGGLRERPTLIAELDAAGAGQQTVDLAYLTGGLSWQADYVAVFDEDAERLQLTGLASLSNASGADFSNARVRLIAGSLNRASAPPMPKMMRAMAMPAAEAMDASVAPVQSFEYYAYDLPRRVTLMDRETRQLPLLAATPLKVSREYRLDSSQGIGWRHAPGGEQRANAAVYLNAKNETGRPLPRGVVRIYGTGDEALQLLGEDTLPHLPAGEKIELLAGQAFDLTARRVQLKHDQLGRDQFAARWQVLVKNAKGRTVEVRVIEPMPGDWKIEDASHPHERLDANRAAWTLKVPANGETKLEYRVSWR